MSDDKSWEIYRAIKGLSYLQEERIKTRESLNHLEDKTRELQGILKKELGPDQKIILIGDEVYFYNGSLETLARMDDVVRIDEAVGSSRIDDLLVDGLGQGPTLNL